MTTNRPALLTTSNPKTLKSLGHGIATAVLHLAPSNLSGRNVCPHASAQCIAGCLNTAGRGGIFKAGETTNPIQLARIARTHRFHADRATFMADLVAEIGRFVRKCDRAGIGCAIRLNGTSDLPWERFPVTVADETFPNVFAAFPDVTFYDYTKWPIRLRAAALEVPNYHLTFSLSDHPDSEDRALNALAAGVNVAVVFDTPKGRDLPATYTLGVLPPHKGLTVPVIDGDETDLRFTDPRGCIVGLRAKGRARGTGTDHGFVRIAA